MLIKLTQRDCKGRERSVDFADSVNRLDFSALSGARPWEVYVIWDGREECIARVNWEPAASYQIWGGFPDGSCPTRIIFRPDCIVPAVKCQLAQLFRDGKIGRLYRQQGIVTVQPME